MGAISKNKDVRQLNIDLLHRKEITMFVFTNQDQFCASFFMYQDSEIIPLHEEQFTMTLECMRVIGYSAAQESAGSTTLNVNPGENIVGVTAAKEFTLMWTASGKVEIQNSKVSVGYRNILYRSSAKGSQVY